MAAIGSSSLPLHYSPEPPAVFNPLTTIHSSWFTDIVSKELLDKVPIVAAEVLGVDDSVDYPVAKPALMPFPAAQGILVTEGSHRPFLALHVTVHNTVTKKTSTYVEFIFQPSSKDPKTYVASPNNPTAEGDTISSSIGFSGAMTPAHVDKITALLLEGKAKGNEPHLTVHLKLPPSAPAVRVSFKASARTSLTGQLPASIYRT